MGWGHDWARFYILAFELGKWQSEIGGSDLLRGAGVPVVEGGRSTPSPTSGWSDSVLMPGVPLGCLGLLLGEADGRLRLSSKRSSALAKRALVGRRVLSLNSRNREAASPETGSDTVPCFVL